MVSSACEVLKNEPERFVDYILSNPSVRSKIVDETSFGNALESSLKSDPTLSNLVAEMKRKGEKIEMCGKGIYDMPSIQKIVQGNVAKKKTQLRRKLKREQPKLKGKAFNQELEKRLNRSVKRTGRRKLKQVTISDALKPIKVKKYFRDGKEVARYRKTSIRKLTREEKILISNAVKKNKSVSKTIQDYYDSGFRFRSDESIRKHYYRMRSLKRK